MCLGYCSSDYKIVFAEMTQDSRNVIPLQPQASKIQEDELVGKQVFQHGHFLNLFS